MARGSRLFAMDPHGVKTGRDRRAALANPDRGGMTKTGSRLPFAVSRTAVRKGPLRDRPAQEILDVRALNGRSASARVLVRRHRLATRIFITKQFI